MYMIIAIPAVAMYMYMIITIPAVAMYLYMIITIPAVAMYIHVHVDTNAGELRTFAYTIPRKILKQRNS